MTVHDGHSGPTPPGERHRTGTGGPDAPGASEGLDAAIEAATIALRTAVDDRDAVDVGIEYGSPVMTVDYDALAAAAVRAAEPILRQAVAEDIARRIEVLEDYEAAEIAREVGRGE